MSPAASAEPKPATAPDLTAPQSADIWHPRWPQVSPTPDVAALESAAGALKLVAVLAAVAMLYFGRDIFVPFAVAALLGFVLDPLVSALRRLGLPRVGAVVAVLLTTLALLGAGSVFIGGQVVTLGKQLPVYQSNVQAKLRGLRQISTNHEALDDATRMIDAVSGELNAAKQELDTAVKRAKPRSAMRVQIEPEPRGAWQTLVDWVEPVLGPAGMAGLVLVLAMFLLLERSSMRDRLMQFVGGDLHRATDAVGEAGERVSKYLGMQLLVNLGFGVPMAIGLWLIGVPGALLWGLLAALLRFVPYLGPVVAASFPLLMALAVDPGWQMLGWTLALIVTLELLSNNVFEPWLYGASTGLSAVSIVFSAVFWTALWGPVGLVLATPLTVCLAVLGRHLPGLRWLDLLLGNAPVFDPPTRLYQRLLAGDLAEAVELAQDQVSQHGLLAFYSETAVPALRLALHDHSRVASAEQRHRLSVGMAALLDELRHDHRSADRQADASATERTGAPSAAAPATLLCIGARWESDSLAAEMLGHVLALSGHISHVLPPSALAAEQLDALDLSGVRMVCLCSFSPAPQAQVRYVARRLMRRHPDLQVLVALWNAPAELLLPQAAQQLGVTAVAHTLGEAVARMVHSEDAALDRPALDAPVGPQDSDRLHALALSGALDPSLRGMLDRAAQRAADVFNMPLAMVSLVSDDCQIWQGAAGLHKAGTDDVRRSPRRSSLCGHVVALAHTLVVPDTARDPRFANNTALNQAGVRFYAGAPLRTASGHVIGALCLMDFCPRQVNAAEQRLLEAMADDVMGQIGTAQRDAGSARPGSPPAEPQRPVPVALPLGSGLASAWPAGSAAA